MSNPTCSCFSARGFTDLSPSLSLLLRVVVEIRNAWRKFEGEDKWMDRKMKRRKMNEESKARLARNKEGRDDEEGENA